MKNIFITGTAGFIGFHLAKLLLKEGFKVHGYDSINDYYDVNLKHARQNILLKDKNFSTTKGSLEDNDKLTEIADKFQPDVIIHLAAQAGVRYSLENPRAYINSNIIGTFNVMEAAKKIKIKHLLMASTSSVYGANKEMPFVETEKTAIIVDVGMSFRATTDDGEQSVIIIDKTDTTVTVDGNHPLAGMSLAFDVEVVDVREASADEIKHGHVHGEGGCGHSH